MDKTLSIKLERERRNPSSWMSDLYWSAVASLATVMTMVQAVFADDIWTKLSSMIYDVYGKILGISTVAAVTVAAVALIIRMVSRNQRAVDEATQWLKRIVITWIILNSLGFIVTYISPLVSGGKYVR